MNCKFVDKSNGELITYRIVQCSSTIHARQSINGNALQIFMQISLNNDLSQSNMSITHLFLSMKDPAFKA